MLRYLDEDDIIIVGAGVIGLCTAYQILKNAPDSGPKPRVKIIDVFEKPFTGASGNCTGCVHYGFPESGTQPMIPLGKYSFDLWADEARGEAFREATGYRAQSSFGLSPGNGQNLAVLPDWVCQEATWNVDTKVLGNETATVNPAGVGEWLTKRCLELGVEIYTAVEVIGVILSPRNKAKAVVCRNKDNATCQIPCGRLLLACGPWTPRVYATLFPTSPVNLKWTTAAGDWILVKNPCQTVRDGVAFVSFADIVGEKLEFAARADGTIWACGRRNLDANLPPPGALDCPDGHQIEQLYEYAQKWINKACVCNERHKPRLELVSTGRGFRPASLTSLPIMSEVPSAYLGSVESPNSCSSSGIFIAWGHGSYGLTLGMGTGRLMSQLMQGSEPDIDISIYSLPRPERGENRSSRL